MAGRGRGRGRGMTFSTESMGYGREDASSLILHPPPLFPPMQFKPLPLSTGDNWEYLVALKQEFHGSMKDSPYFIKAVNEKHDIKRYSDKYQIGNDANNKLHLDWKRFPKELRSIRKARKRPIVKPVVLAPKEKKIKTEDITKTLEELEKKESVAENDGEEEKEEGEEVVEEEEYYDEEDVEEGTDYILSYFDNGENYLDEEDDNLDDEATYS